MDDTKNDISTNATGSRTSGVPGSAGRTDDELKNRCILPNTSTGKWMGAPPEAVTHQPGQEESEEGVLRQTSAMLRGITDRTK
jgi:hypothetical protein